MSRPTFYYHDHPVRAGGVIFFRFRKKRLQLLLIESKRGIEDIGGCSDAIDTCSDDMVARETDEETNQVVTKEEVHRLFKKKPVVHFYSKQSKYLFHIIRATKRIGRLTSDLFGDREYHDDIERSIGWVNYPFVDKKLQYRMKEWGLHKILKAIEKGKPLSEFKLTDELPVNNRGKQKSDQVLSGFAFRPVPKHKK